MKKRVRHAVRLLKAIATDPRIPRPLRWLIGVSLAVKAVPVPDFGVDEAGLLVAFVLLSTVYRHRFAEIREEVRQEEDRTSGTTPCPSTPQRSSRSASAGSSPG